MSWLNIDNNAIRGWYNFVRGNINNIGVQINQNIYPSNSQRETSFWFDVRKPDILFTGRRKELENLHKEIQRHQGENEQKLTVISQVTSISGLGGIGKSELARVYAYEHSQDYEGNVIWINAEKYETIIDSFYRLARDKLNIATKSIDGKEKDIKSIVGDVYRYFAKKKSLFIFDGAEKYRTQKEEDEGIDKFMPLNLPPNANEPYILITSRNQEWGKGVEVLSLGTFTDEEAIEFIKKALDIKGESQEKEVKLLAEKLQYFLLALQQAVAYIRVEDTKIKNIGQNEKFEISDYLKEFEEKTKELLDFPVDVTNPYNKTTFITWVITIDKIKEEVYGKQALELMDIIACFSPNNIPAKIFLKLVNDDKRILASIIQLPKQYSMFNIEQGRINIHRLVQEVTRLNVKEKEKEKDTLEKALKLLDKTLKEADPDDMNYTFHAISAWDFASEYDKLVEEFSGIPNQIIVKLINGIRYEEAHTYAVRASELLKRSLGSEHNDTLKTKHNLAIVLDMRGKYEEAFKTFSEVYEKLKEVLGPDHPHTLAAQNGMAIILIKQMKFEEAFQIFSEVYKKLKEVLRPDHPVTLNSQNDMAAVLFIQGKFEESFHIYSEVYEKFKEVLGPDHPDTLNSQNGMAGVLRMQGKYEEAFQAYSELYEISKEILGPDHPNTLMTRGNMAVVLNEKGKYEEAFKIFSEVYEKFEEVLGPDHPITLATQNGMAGILHIQGKYEQSFQTFSKVYENFKKVFGPDDPMVSMTGSVVQLLAIHQQLTGYQPGPSGRNLATIMDYIEEDID